MRASTKHLSGTTLHPDWRWDGEYLCFEPYKNKKFKYVPIGDVLLFSQYGLSIKMNEEENGTKIYRMNEISNMLCDRNILKYAEIGPDIVRNYTLNDRDVLFNRTNSQKLVGRTGMFRKFSNEDFVFASYLVRIRPNSDIITPEYLTAFLNSRYGILDIKRRARISINQSNVNAEELKRVEIPLLSNAFQLNITTVFENAFNFIQSSEEKYAEAEILLLSELGLINWQPIRRLTFVRDHLDINQAKRIDAEYYQPKYEQITKTIKGYSGGYNMLGNLVNLKVESYEPDSKTKYKYIELANIENNGEITDCMIEKGQNLPSRARREALTNDVIVSSIEGSLSSIALITEEYNQALCSTGFHVINSSIFNSETLLVLLKSVVGQMQLKKGCNGTILAAIDKYEFGKIVLPKVSEEVQTKIQKKVAESFNLRKQSKYILTCAKKTVEIAIEQDEQTAIKWLEDETNEMISVSTPHSRGG